MILHGITTIELLLLGEEERCTRKSGLFNRIGRIIAAAIAIISKRAIRFAWKTDFIRVADTVGRCANAAITHSSQNTVRNRLIKSAT
jgi:hypothetical protein